MDRFQGYDAVIMADGVPIGFFTERVYADEGMRHVLAQKDAHGKPKYSSVFLQDVKKKGFNRENY